MQNKSFSRTRDQTDLVPMDPQMGPNGPGPDGPPMDSTGGRNEQLNGYIYNLYRKENKEIHENHIG